MVASPSAPSPARKRGIRNRPDVGSGRLVVLPAGDGGLGEGHRCRRSPRGTRSPLINPATPHFNPRGYID